MPLKAAFCKHTLNFKFDAGTSRGVLKTKDSYFIKLYDGHYPEVNGIGEASPLPGLSIDFKEDLSPFLDLFIDKFNASELTIEEASEAIESDLFFSWPSIRFAFEMALLDLSGGGSRVLFNNSFAQAKSEIEINGLIWMGDEAFMSKQIVEKLKGGFRTIKMKIGSIDFDTEYKLLKTIRSQFSADELTLRVDANGAFSSEEAKSVLDDLAKLNIHSIEQPIKAGQWDQMAELCKTTPVPIALDEELIGITGSSQPELLDLIKPQFLIFKPTLLGGFKATDEWMLHAKDRKINWWITSALEANIGLNAICQYTFSKGNTLPQGLGTGSLFDNNIPCPLLVEDGFIHTNGPESWDLSLLNFES
ncbi:MAG: O-succinylbenzoate synthase [Arcticibacterium sp.]|jgi:O-succinylbenzoate synthase